MSTCLKPILQVLHNNEDPASLVDRLYEIISNTISNLISSNSDKGSDVILKSKIHETAQITATSMTEPTVDKSEDNISIGSDSPIHPPVTSSRNKTKERKSKKMEKFPRIKMKVSSSEEIDIGSDAGPASVLHVNPFEACVGKMIAGFVLTRQNIYRCVLLEVKSITDSHTVRCEDPAPSEGKVAGIWDIHISRLVNFEEKNKSGKNYFKVGDLVYSLYYTDENDDFSTEFYRGTIARIHPKKPLLSVTFSDSDEQDVHYLNLVKASDFGDQEVVNSYIDE